MTKILTKYDKRLQFYIKYDKILTLGNRVIKIK